MSLYQGLIPWKYGLSSQGLQLSSICRDVTACEKNILGFPSTVLWSCLFLPFSLLLPVYGKFMVRMGFFWFIVQIKSKEKSWEPGPWLFWPLQQSSPVAVTQLFLFSSRTFSARRWVSFPSNSGRLGRGKSSMLCYLAEFFWLVSHSWCGHFYFGCVKSAWVVSLSRGGSTAWLVLAGQPTRSGVFPWCFPTRLLSLPAGLAQFSCLHLLVLAFVLLKESFVFLWPLLLLVLSSCFVPLEV